MYSSALSGASFTVPGPLRTKKSPSFEENRFRAALAARHADGLALHDLGLWVDAGSCTVAHAVPHHLGEVAHEFVVSPKLVALDADDRAVIRHAEQEVAALGVEEGGNRTTAA
jgi:hypothetical protein